MFSLSSVSNLADALRRLDRLAFDAVLIGWRRPHRSSAKICKELRAACPMFVPILVLADDADEIIAAENATDKADHYVGWPRLSKALVENIIDHHLTEWELREQSIFTNTILGTVDTLIMIVDPKGRIAYANRAFERTLGYSAEEVEGRPCWDFLSDKRERAQLKKLIARLSSTDRPPRMENRWQHKDGSERLISWSHCSLRRGDGSARNIICTGLDVTRQRQAEETLKSSQERLADAQRIAHLGNWERNIKTDELWWSDEVYRIFGVEPKKFDGSFKAFLQLVYPDDRKKVEAAGRRALEEDGGYSIDYRIQRPDGTLATIYAESEVEYDDNNKPIHFRGTVLDVTGRMEAEATADRFGRIVDESSNEIYVFRADTLRFVKINRGARRNLGYSSREMRQLTPLDITPKMTRRKFSNLLKPLRTGENEQIIFETVHKRKDGSLYPVEIRLQLFAGETPPLFVAMVQDITERKQAEEALRKAHDELELRIHERTLQLRQEVEERKWTEAALAESERRFKDMVEAASDWLWEIGPDSRFTYLSDSMRHVLGVQPENVIGKKRISATAPNEGPEKWRRHMDDLENRRPFRDFQYEFVRPDGSTQFVTISGKPVFDDDGEFLGYRGTGTNITAQVRAERRAVEAQDRLIQALETIPEGVALFDSDDRFVLCNNTYRKMLDHMGFKLAPDTMFRDMVVSRT